MLGFLPTRAYRPGTPGATTFLSPLSGTFNYGWDSFQSGGFSAQWAHHAFRERYLLAFIKAPNDPEWFQEVHTLLYGIRGLLTLVGIEPQGVKPSRASPVGVDAQAPNPVPQEGPALYRALTLIPES